MWENEYVPEDEEGQSIQGREPSDREERLGGWHNEPRVITCRVCGRGVVELADPLENECPQCGTLYNLAGQKVLPRHLYREDGGDVEIIGPDER